MSYIYKIETHLHTNQASACARNTGAQMARACKDQGCCAIFVTDHFFNGNTSIRQSYPWNKKISVFMQGYADAKAEGDKIGLDVYFGFEFADNGTEFLIYNFGAEKLRAYPGIMTDGIKTVLAKIRSEGGFVVHAHPFRYAPWIAEPSRIFPDHTDAVEVLNASRPEEENILALEYAEKYNLIKFGGSDAHSANPANWNGGGMAFARKPESFEDIIDMAKKEECVILGG
jgi:hypothetical protein